MSRRKNREYRAKCQDCGYEQKSKTRSVYRCDFCRSFNVDVDDGCDNYLASVATVRKRSLISKFKV